jgi:cell division protein FtsB
MAKNIQEILELPLVAVLIGFLAILLILSLQENKNKSLIDSDNLQQNQENIELLEKKVKEKEEFLQQAQDDLYKEKLIRDELVKNKEGEIVVQIPSEDFEAIKETKQEALDKSNCKVQNWSTWWKLLTKQ